MSDELFEARVRSAVPELNGNLTRWDGANGMPAVGDLGALMVSCPEVVAFGPGMTLDTVLDVATEIDCLHPDVEVLIVAEPSPRLWERAARAGVREVVSPLAATTELATAVRRAMATAGVRRSRRGPEPAPDDPAHVLVVVRSPKGGSGKTMIASNVAVSLAHRHHGEVVLVDLDLQYGDIASALGIEPSYTIADATANVDLTPTTLKTLLSTHRSSLYALCAPPRPEEAAVITGDDVTAMLALLRSAFRYVIVDTAGGLDERVLAALGEATDVLVVCTMDVSSVRAVRKEFDGHRPGDGDPKVHVVLNRANSKVGLEPRDIEATIGRPIGARISSARSVPFHMNCGVPVVEADPSCPVSRQLRELVSSFDPSVASPRRGLGRRW